jgi:chaperonin GroES
MRRAEVGFSDHSSPNFLMVAEGGRLHTRCMRIRPLHDHVLVKRIEEQQKTSGGLIIPDSAKEKPMEAVIVAVGAGKVQEDGTLRKMDVKEGDRVLFTKYSGNEIKIDGTEHLILREDDILAVVS